MAINVGVAQIDITPPSGLALTGYIARDGNATGCHDPLFAKALFFHNDTTQAVLITCDLLGLHGRDVATIRSAIATATGVPPTHVMITCSHTHAGPAVMFLQDCGEIDAAYLATLHRQLVDLVLTAQANLRPARFGLGVGEVRAGVHNRRTPGDVTDPTLGILRITDHQGQPLANVLNFTCHPTCLTGENRLWSAEYPGYAVAKVQAATGAITLFITGAIGDVGPIERGWPVLEQLGEAVAHEALRVLPNISVKSWRKLAVATQSVALPLLTPPTTAALAQEIAEQQQQTSTTTPGTLPFHPKIPGAMLAWAQRILGQIEQGQDLTVVHTEIQVLRVGTLVLVSAPGELFVELGLGVKRGAGRQAVFVCGFANDNIGYIPTRRAYPKGGYEIAEAYKYYGYAAACAPEAGEKYVATARQLMRAV